MDRTSTQFDAIYENGVLRPLSPVDLPAHERLSVIVNRPVDSLADVLDWDAHELAGSRRGRSRLAGRRAAGFGEDSGIDGRCRDGRSRRAIDDLKPISFCKGTA